MGNQGSLDCGGFRLFVATIDASGRFNGVWPEADYAALLWIHSREPIASPHVALVRGLLRTGCRYFVCGGEYAAMWESLIDDEFVVANLGSETAPPVVTTSHEGESLEDVAFYFGNCVSDHTQFSRRLLVHVGTGANAAQVEDAVCAALEATMTSPDS